MDIFEKNLALANEGNATAMYFVGMSYYYGSVKNEDPNTFSQKAEYWLIKSAVAGNVRARRMLAVCYWCDNKYKAAYDNFKLAAEEGDVEAYYYLGEFYSGEYELYEDVADELRDKAAECYLRAYLGGYKDAKSGLLGLRREVPTSDAEDFKFAELKYNASLGLMHAEFELGHLYIREDLDYNKFDEAFVLFNSSAEKGYGAAAYFVGFCYEKGIGVAKNPEKALEWYSRVAAGEFFGSPSYVKNGAAAYEKLCKKVRKPS